MKNRLLILLLFSILGQFLNAQNTSKSIYKNLETKKVYNFSLSSNPRLALYKVNGRKVDQATYNKYHQINQNYKTCCPCILQTHNFEEQLLREGVSCGDCSVGWFKEYYPNGHLKLAGHFKENDTGDWDDIYKRGYCGVPDGKWIFYNKNGAPKYVELWDNGLFLKQIPEQKEVAIWKILFLLEDKDLQWGTSLSLDEAKKIKIIPKYKNSHTTSNLKIKLSLSLVGHPSKTQFCTPENLKDIDLKQLISEMEAPKEAEIGLSLNVYDGNKYITHTNLQLTQSLF